ncbi:MAG: hypothetical protein ACKERG_03710 [Candidatus Hodgkinia cicadicola]
MTSSGLNPKVSCSLCLGLWVITSVTCLGGRPHAEAVGASKLGREQPQLAVLSLSPCCDFGKTPPCCYIFLMLRCKLVLLSFDETQMEAVKLLRKACGVGWTSSAVLSSAGCRIEACRDLASKVGRLKLRLPIRGSDGVSARLRVAGLLAVGAVNGGAEMKAWAGALAWRLSRMLLCSRVDTSGELVLASSADPVWWTVASNCWPEASALSCGRCVMSSKLAAKAFVFCEPASVRLLAVEFGLLLAWAWKCWSKLPFSSAAQWTRARRWLAVKRDADLRRRLFVKLEALDV